MADLIDRKLLLTGMDSVLCSMWQKYATDPYLNKVVSLVQAQRDFVAAQPIIDPESLRKKGEWIVCGVGDNASRMCSRCGKTTAHKYKVMYVNFCPNCGADMRKERSYE